MAPPSAPPGTTKRKARIENIFDASLSSRESHAVHTTFLTNGRQSIGQPIAASRWQHVLVCVSMDYES